MPPLPVTYSAEEVAEALSVSRRWLLEMAASDPARFPSIKLAGRVRFTEPQVEHIITAATRQAREETQAERAARAWGRPAPRAPRRPRPAEWR